MDNQEGGYGNFPFHLLHYLYHRDFSNEGADYNPTSKSPNSINGDSGVMYGYSKPYKKWCIQTMKLPKDVMHMLYKKGDQLAFKRAMKPVCVKGQLVEIRPSFQKLKKILKITKF